MYHYTESGLRNVWLVNGFKVEKSKYGNTVAFDNIAGLHKGIGRTICSTSPRLKGAEVRFLRSEMDLSQAALAKLLGNDAQSVALWEKSKVTIPKWADRLLRALYREHSGENVSIRALVEKAVSLESEGNQAQRISAEKAANGWKLKAA
jgi:putative transcriptional regulator